MGKGARGLKWINNGTKSKRVSINDIDNYIADGWVVGQLSTTLGHIWINKDGKNTTINKSELAQYLANGWTKGKILSDKEIGRVKVNKNGKTKLIPKDQLDEYLADGWIRGIHQKFRWITNDSEEKWTDIDLPKGWRTGRLYKNPEEIIYVYNDFEVIQIKKLDLPKYKQLGYKLGKGKKVGLYEGSTKDTLWMNDGSNTILINKKLEQEYIENGYIRGNLNTKDTIAVNNGNTTKRIRLSDLSEYINDGYSLGTHHTNHMVNKRWVQQNGKYKAVPLKEYDNYLATGWIPGRPIHASKDKIWVHKDDERTYIDYDELKDYLNDGWHSGLTDNQFYINNGIEDKLVNWDEYNLNYRFNESWKFGTMAHGCTSTIEDEFKKLLDNNNIEYKQHFHLQIKGRHCYYYDFKIGNILIELNPTATHNTTWSPHGNPRSIDYHYQKTLFANNNGYRCINIWDWDSIDTLLYLLTPRDTIYARKCVIKEVPIKEAKQFLNTYHFQGYSRDSIRLGLYYKDSLVSIMTFGKPRYNKNYEFELIRYCSNSNVIGGSAKLFSYFVNNYEPKSIISYCNLDKFNGDMYNTLGFVYKNYTIGKHWYNFEHKLHFTDNLVRSQGFDRLCGSIYGTYGKGTSNDDLLLEHDFVELYDAGQAKYVWTNNR